MAEGGRALRVQELTLDGAHVRFIGQSVITHSIFGVATNNEFIAVTKHNNQAGDRVMLFDVVSGELVRAFGAFGDAPGQLMQYCYGVRFTDDGDHVVVADSSGFPTNKGRLSVFTLHGEFVKCIGEGELTRCTDVEFAGNGDILACDWSKHRVLMFPREGSASIGHIGDGRSGTNGSFVRPSTMALCRTSGQLYVLDEFSSRVQVFE